MCAALSLLGWFLDFRWLIGFGFAVRTWPWTAIGLIVLSAGFLALLHGPRRVGQAALLLVLALAAVASLQTLAGWDAGIDRLFFGDRFEPVLSGRAPGRPPLPVIVEWTLLVAALLLAGGRSGWRCRGASIMASLPLATATMSAGLLAIGVPMTAEAALYLGTSLPTAASVILIGIGICFWCQGAEWPGTRVGGSDAASTFAFFFPFLLLIPALVALFEMAMAAFGIGTHFIVEAFSGAVTVLLVACILAWALGRLSKQQAALGELTRALDSAPIALVNGAGVLKHWSQGCERLYGWSAQEAVGVSKYQLLKTSPAAADAAITELRQGEMLERELTDLTKDGREVRVVEHAHRIDAGDDAPMIVLSMIDISARSRIETELGLSRERLADAVEAYGLGMYEWDARSGDLTWSPGSEERLGIEPGAIHDFESWRENVHPDDFVEVMEALERASEAQADRFSFRYRYRAGTPEERRIEATGRLYYDDAGLTQAVGVAFDATEREAREERLREQAAQLQSMLETVPDAMIVFDSKGTIIHFGAGAVRTLGYESSEMVGRSFLEIAPDRLRDDYARALSLYLGTGRRRLIGRVSRSYARRADGTELPVEVLVGEATTGNTRLFTLLLRDVTERLAIEDRLSGLSAELAHVSRLSAMGEMAAGIAHELNQPLTAVSNYLAAAGVLIRSGKAELEKLRELMEIAGSQTIRAGQIIRRMRNFAAKGQVEVKAEPVAETLQEAAALVFVGPMPRQISLVYDLDPAARTMLVDRIQVQQVLVNLIRNAAQALQRNSVPRKEITVSAHSTGNGMIEIGVSDTGPGLPAAVLTKLFEPFTSSDGNGGMGVGLSICRRIVEAHEGMIWAENREEGGASFRFTVPGLNEKELQEV